MSVADKLHQRQMALRKKSGLPHPDYYKELGHSYNISDDKERLAKQSEIKKKYKVEEVEQLDEMPESSMKTRDVHAHLKKTGWTLKRTGGGHDVYSHPKSKEHIAVPRHKQLKAPLIRGIMKASRVSEETEIEEQLEKKGRFVSGPVKKPYKSSTIVSPIKEAKDAREYDYEGDMAMSQLRSLIFNAEDMMDLMDDNTNLPEWVQSKITLAEDYISTAANYLRGELNEEVKRYVPSPHGTPVPKKPKGEYERKVDKYLKKKYNKEEVELDEGMEGGTYVRRDLSGRPIAPKSTLSFRKYAVKSDGTQGKELKVGTLTPYTDKEKRERDSEEVRSGHISADKYKEHMKKYGHLYNKEEVELSEGRPSQRHPLEGHEYHKKTDAELEYIGKDAHKAAEAMKGHNEKAENKYRDQANDAATVRYFRKKSGTPDWYKKKYGHVKEEVELNESPPFKTKDDAVKYAKEKVKTHRDSLDGIEIHSHSGGFDVNHTSNSSGRNSLKKIGAKHVTTIYKEDTDEPSAAARTLSRKAQIVKDAAKGKKREQDEASDKFQKDPELSSDIQKT